MKCHSYGGTYTRLEMKVDLNNNNPCLENFRPQAQCVLTGGPVQESD